MIALNILLAVLVVVLLIGNLWLYWRVLRPLRQLAAKANQLAEGNFTALAYTTGELPAIETIRAAMNAMVGHVRRSQAQEHAYIRALTDGQEAERSRIAHELHDDTTQSLIAIAQSLEITQSMISSDIPAVALMKTARLQAVETVDNLRRLIADLRPPILAELGLIPALRVLAEARRDVEVRIETTGSVRRLTETHELTLFRSAQEAILNAQRHGHAQHTMVQVNYQPNAVHMVIQDDGIGFTVPDSLNSLPIHGHYGLIGIRERLQNLDGKLTITSQPGNGTRLDIRLCLAQGIQPEGIVRDPVCSALIMPQQAYASLVHNSQRYYFCCPVCQGAFQADPMTYLIESPSQPL